MKKIKSFLNIVNQSLTKPEFYKEVINKPISFSIRYLYYLITLLFLVQSIFLFIFLAPNFFNVHEKLIALEKQTKSLYPDELTLRVKNGELKTNSNDPIHIDSQLISENKIDHLIIIDQNAYFKQDEIYNTLILMTKSEMILFDNKNQIVQKLTYKDLELAFSLTKMEFDQYVKDYYQKLIDIEEFLPILALVSFLLIPFVAGLFVTVGKLMYLLLLSFFIQFLSIIFGQKIPYKKVFQMSIHGLTVPIILSLFISIFGVDIPMVYTSSFLLWMVYVLSKIKNSSTKD